MARSLVLLLMALVAGCAHKVGAPERGPAVVGGEPATDSTPGAASTVLLVMKWSPEGWARCTGTLISDNVVLTAAHCVVDEDDRLLGTTLANSKKIIAEGKVGTAVFTGTGTQVRQIIDVEVAPGYSASRFDGSDLALLRLESGGIRGARPAKPAVERVRDFPFRADHEYLAIGYGRVNEGDRDEVVHRMLEEENLQGLLQAIDFRFRQVQPLRFLEQSHLLTTAGVAPGDSGGPLFRLPEEGGILLVGVTCEGGGTEDAGFSFVGEKKDWLNKFLGKWR